jgi:hypothetical protein
MNFELNAKCRYSRAVRRGESSEGRSIQWPDAAGSVTLRGGDGGSGPRPRADTQPVFFIASLILTAALPAASCRVAVVRCEYRCVTLLVLWPKICCTS